MPNKSPVSIFKRILCWVLTFILLTSASLFEASKAKAAVSVNWNGTAYSIPEAGETNWSTLTDFLVALGSYAQTTGKQVNGVRVATSSPVTVATTDYTVVMNRSSSGVMAVTLPTGVLGQVFVIADGKGDAATNNVTVSASGGQTINGSATHVINENYGGAIFQFNGTQWNGLADFVGANPSFATLTITGNTTLNTLTVTGASTLAAVSGTTGTFSGTFNATGNTTLGALQVTGNIQTGGVLVPSISSTSTLTNKTLGSTNTLTGATAASFTNVGTITLPSSTSTLATLALSETLTNKTLTSPTISGSPVISGATINTSSIGATTPGSGAFTTLSSTGAATLGNSAYSGYHTAQSAGWIVTPPSGPAEMSLRAKGASSNYYSGILADAAADTGALPVVEVYTAKLSGGTSISTRPLFGVTNAGVSMLSVSASGSLAVTNNATVGGTLGVTGAGTFSSTLTAGPSTGTTSASHIFQSTSSTDVRVMASATGLAYHGYFVGGASRGFVGTSGTAGSFFTAGTTDAAGDTSIRTEGYNLNFGASGASGGVHGRLAPGGAWTLGPSNYTGTHNFNASVIIQNSANDPQYVYAKSGVNKATTYYQESDTTYNFYGYTLGAVTGKFSTVTGAWAIGPTAGATHTVNGQFQYGLTGESSGGDYDNYALPAASSVIRFSAGGNLRGVTSGASGKMIYIVATGGTPLVIKNEDGVPTAANRIITGSGADVTITGDGGATLIYDGASNRWRVVSLVQ